MPYIIDNRAGQTVIIPDEALNQDFSIDLVGRNYENYGAIIAKSFLDILDNFASPSAPANQTDGQLWFDTSSDLLRVYDNTQGLWAPLLPIVTASGSPIAENAKGTLYFDKQVGKLFINDGTGFRSTGIPGEVNTGFSTEVGLGTPARVGTRLRNIFIEDTAGTPRPVVALSYVNSAGTAPTFSAEEKVIAIFSGHAEFTATNLPYSTEGGSIDMYNQLTEAGGIGVTIRPGMNLRTDNDTHVERANQAYRADTAYALNTGSYGADSANITASQVFFDSNDSIPSANATYDIGSIAARLDKIHAQDFLVGNAILALGNNVTIGTTDNAFNTIFVDDITIKGNIIMPDGGDIGEPTSPIDNGYFTNLFVTNELQVGTAGNNGYAFPVDDGTHQQQLFTDGSGQLQFADPLSNIASIRAGGGLTVAYTPTTDPSTGLTTREARLDVTAGNGITVLEDEVFVQENEVNHDGLLNFVANEHINHSSVNITAGSGLTGGGDITQSRTINVGAGTGITVNANNIAVNMSAFTTTNLAEGNNLYYTNARARGAISKLNQTAVGYGDVTYDQSTGQLGFTRVTDANIRGSLSGTNGVNYNQSQGKFSLDVSYGRTNLYSAGSGISIDSNGVIKNTGVISIDTGDFMTLAGTQTAGGYKYFSAGIEPLLVKTSRIDFDNEIRFASQTPGKDLWMMTDGSFRAEGDITAFYNASDIRLKENLKPIEGALSKVDLLNGYTFNYKNRKDEFIPGLIAQDVQKVLPEAVYNLQKVDDSGEDYLGVRYETLVPLLVEAIKELKAEVDELKKGK